jgi:hydrogenase-4 component F
MPVILFSLPLGFALLAYFIRSERLRPWVVTIAAFVQLPLVFFALTKSQPLVALNGWLELDPIGKIALGFTTVLFAACALYLPGYMAQRSEKRNRIFCCCVLAFQGVLTLVTMAHHIGLLWVAMEACTLSTAPLIYFNRNSLSIEATWKYLLVGSVGIALALFGTFLLGYAVLCGGKEPSLLLSELVKDAPSMSRPWLHVAFVVLLVGYGTKMGLAPMHSWKPDAYGEAPGLTGTLLAGGLTSGAFLAILRIYRVCAAAGESSFARQPLIALGLISMLVAGVFMARQKDYKRMLAYSSVEHMGILVLGIGIGKMATFGALLHLINNGLTKGVLFLSAANIHRAFGSKSTDDVRGAWGRVPVSATLLLLGFFAITGSPPFGPFISEFTIVSAAFASGQYFVASSCLVLLVVVFIGMGSTVLSVVQGEATPVTQGGDFTIAGERWLTYAPGIVLLALVLMLGVYIPPPINQLLREASIWLEAP